MTFSVSRISESNREKLRTPAMASWRATWLPPEPQPAISTRASLSAPTSNSGASRANSLSSSLTGHSFLFGPLAGLPPRVVVAKPLPRECQGGKHGMFPRIPAAQHAVEAKSAVLPAMRWRVGDRVRINARAGIWVSVRQNDLDV